MLFHLKRFALMQSSHQPFSQLVYFAVIWKLESVEAGARTRQPVVAALHHNDGKLGIQLGKAAARKPVAASHKLKQLSKHIAIYKTNNKMWENNLVTFLLSASVVSFSTLQN